jgi:hypothetical protein
MNIYRKDIEFNLDHILITDFGDVVEMRKSIRKENKIDFSSIKSIMGDKNIINLSFQDQLKESIANG